MLFLFSLMFACGNFNYESDINTSDIYANIIVETREDGAFTSVKAVLLENDDSLDKFVYLNDDDIFTASIHTWIGDNTNQLTFSDDDYKYYGTNFYGEIESNNEIIISLLRSVEVDAPFTTVTLAEPLILSSVSDFSRAEGLSINWSNSGLEEGSISININGDCISEYNEQILGDPGVWTIPGGTLIPIDETIEESCLVNINVLRTRVGFLDPAFADGNASLIQRSMVTVLSQP